MNFDYIELLIIRQALLFTQKKSHSLTLNVSSVR